MLHFSIPRLPVAVDYTLNLNHADVQDDLKKSFEEKETLMKDCQKELLEIVKDTIHRKRDKKNLHVLHQDLNIALEKQKEMLKTAKQKQKEKEAIEEKRSLFLRILNLYEKNLGFRIEKIKLADAGRNEYPLGFSFTDIKSNSEKKFSLVLSTDGQNYKVLKCIPSIDSLDELTSALNKSNDLSKFIIQVRRTFCQS